MAQRRTPSRRRASAVLGALALLVLVVAAALWSPGAPPAAPTSARDADPASTPAAAADPLAASAQPVTDERSAAPSEPPADRVRVTVRDVLGQPIAAAALRRYTASSTLAAPAPAPALALTAADGIATFAAAAPTRLSIGRPDYAPVVLRVENGHDYEVVLQPAHTLRVRAETPFHKPIAGVEFTLSMGGSAAFRRDRAPGLEPRTAIYTARTGDDGTAAIAGLAAGSYRLHAPFSPTHVPVAGNVFPQLRVDVPGGDVSLVFVELCAAVVTFAGDEFVGYRDLGFRRLGSPGGAGGIGWNLARDALRARYPESFVLVFAPRLDTTEPPEVTIAPFTKWRGELPPMTVALQPLSLLTPQLVDVSAVPRKASAQSARVRFRVEDRDGRAVEFGRDDGFCVHVCDGPYLRDKSRAVLRPNTWCEVAPGPSHFVPVSNLYHGVFAVEPLQLAAGDERDVVLRCAQPMRPVRFEVAIDGAADDVACVMSHATGSAGELGLASITPGGTAVWMMAGEWSGEFFTDGCQPMIARWTVDAAHDGCTVPLAFESDER